MLVDTHCHLDFPEFDHDRDEVIRRAQEQGVGYIVNIGSSLEGSIRSVELAAKFDSVYATVGIHPHEADNFGSSDRDRLMELAKNNKVVAVGEIGLDYYPGFFDRKIRLERSERPLGQIRQEFDRLSGVSQILPAEGVHKIVQSKNPGYLALVNLKDCPGLVLMKFCEFLRAKPTKSSSDFVVQPLRGKFCPPRQSGTGKIGDYKNYSQADNQRKLFVSLLGLAKELNLPAVVHSREASGDTLKILKENMPAKVVVHCFSGSGDFLRECLGLGFFISFTSNITYRKAQELRDLVKVIPLNRLMLETDAPFLAPEGLRGKRNEPAYVKNLAEEVSRIKAVSIEELASATTHNAKEFFNLPAT